MRPGEVVRTFEPAVEGEERDRWSGPALPVGSGLQRLRWDLRTDPAASFPGMLLRADSERVSWVRSEQVHRIQLPEDKDSFRGLLCVFFDVCPNPKEDRPSSPVGQDVNESHEI